MQTEEDYLQMMQQNIKSGKAGGQYQDILAGAQQINEQEGDAIDQAITKLKFHLLSFGFPDPGNLRSHKKKDVKLRIKCYGALLK